MAQRQISNFESFLDNTTARVSVNCPPEICGSYSSLREVQQFQSVIRIRLRDIWDAYESWSTYGVSVHLSSDSTETTRITQYYTPYLSAIQIFTKPTQPPSRSLEARRLVESNPRSSYPRRGLTSDHVGSLYFQYNDTTKPYNRTPLTYMMAELAEEHHGLFNLTTAELSPYSWFSIAWYPIYQIPAKKNWKELSASFLTYHGFTPMTPEAMPGDENNAGPSDAKVPLRAFGAVTLKGYTKFWLGSGTSGPAFMEKHEESAASWLQTLQFNQSDFNFFMSRRPFSPFFPSAR